ncbi:MAG: hypothetical protein J6R61_03830, partial [Bacteroidales bacterium]|nr:hypothetical protein [Bacteroidales bacterium]
MKKVLFISLLIFVVTSINAQQIDKNELKQLKTFLFQISHSNKTNAQIIGIKDLNNPSSWQGVEWSNGHLKSIMWRGLSIEGELNLSNMVYLQNVDLSRNKLTKINVSGCSNL